MENRSMQNQGQELQRTQMTAAQRFTASVIKQFEAEAGAGVQFTEYEQKLAQHLFLKIDSTLKELDKKRKSGGTPITWENVNMRKLALDAVHTVQLGLDALVKAHVYPIPYWNDRTQKYDIDLRVGYRGEMYYRSQAAVEAPVSVRLELVYDTDTFRPIMQDYGNKCESYEFKINQPFNRGKVIGGFAYMIYNDERKNKLVLVGADKFEKARKCAKSDEFWSKHTEEMQFKTLVHRAMATLEVDPKKVNAAAYAAVEEADIDNEIDRNANGAAITIDDGRMVEMDADALRDSGTTTSSSTASSTAGSQDTGYASVMDDGEPPF